MTTLYIAGPMTGLADLNYPAFHDAERQLVAAGFAVLNPARNEVRSGDPTWLAYMRLSIQQVALADGLALLDGWRASRGATLEVAIADGLDLPRRTVEFWVREATRAEIRPTVSHESEGTP